MAEINENKVLSEWPDEWKNPTKAIRARCLDCCCYNAISGRGGPGRKRLLKDANSEHICETKN